MRITNSWRLVKFFILAGVVTISVNYVLSKILAPSGTHNNSTLDPLPWEQYRVISPDTYKYVIDQRDACADRSPFLVLVVPVAPGDSESRGAIRRTWGARGLIPGVDVLTLFYVGLPPKEEDGVTSSSIQEDLWRESREHADVIQMDFLDSYRNLTIKTAMLMNWLATRCPRASYAMKVDADIFVNVFYLVGDVLRGVPTRDFITGSVISDGRPRRDKKSKWFIPEDVYPEDAFPPYVSGAGYVFSMDMPARISRAARFVRVIPLEDVYVGLCLRVMGVRPVYSRRLLTTRNLFEIRRLDYDRCTYAKRVIVTGFEPRELLEIWQDFHEGHLAC